MKTAHVILTLNERASYRPGFDEETILLTLEEGETAIHLPYIHGGHEILVWADWLDLEWPTIRLGLKSEAIVLDKITLTPEEPDGYWKDVPPGEYTLFVECYDASKTLAHAAEATGVGVGHVIAALGDSITEGYFGNACRRDEEELTAGLFPDESISRDGRNFPRHARTTAAHWPEVNCMESWMTRLNDRLAESLARPVFIDNEGWGGIRTDQYLEKMEKDFEWRDRVNLLKPDIWLIHLGVNDERARRSAAEVGASLEGMLRFLTEEHGADPKRIFLAKPCYDYAEGAEPILESYCEEIDRLVAQWGLSKGPDFFAAYSREKERWYGADPVHPNIAGMERMADLWHDTLVTALAAEEAARPLAEENEEDE